MRKFCTFLLLLCLLFVQIPSFAETNGAELEILFTHDTHDYLYPTQTIYGDEMVEHGGAARLMTLLRRYSSENSLYLDAGDFSMGTLYQAAYATDAYELRNLGLCGCAVTTFGNHEFDYGSGKAAEMLRAALASGDPLPAIVQSNIDLSGDLTEDQKAFRDALAEYGAQKYTVIEKAGWKIGIFGLVGYDAIECIQTPFTYIDYIEAAKSVVSELKELGCDCIIALSHTGTNGKGSGEDITLAQEVPDIDVIVSGHSHSTYSEPYIVGRTIIVSAGEYLRYLGRLVLRRGADGPEAAAYELIPIDASVEEDPETAARFAEYRVGIENGYLAQYGVTFDEVICHSDFDLMSLDEMYATHQEYPMGNIIADSYLYEARRCGIDDIDVALVGLGTIRSSITKGDITCADIFEICSLGVGGDGSAGHPLVCAYLTGKDLKLLVELDASLGTKVSSIKMSYSGLEYTFNSNRIILDEVTSVGLKRADGTVEKIENRKRYKVVCNMYAVNMLGMLNGLTKGMLAITPLDADGKPITDFYTAALKDESGTEIKEWAALLHYLGSFDKNAQGVSELPAYYAQSLGRKVREDERGLSAIRHPGTATKIIPYLIGGLVLLIAVLTVINVRLSRHIKKLVRAKKQKKKNK